MVNLPKEVVLDVLRLLIARGGEVDEVKQVTENRSSRVSKESSRVIATTGKLFVLMGSTRDVWDGVVTVNDSESTEDILKVKRKGREVTRRIVSFGKVLEEKVDVEEQTGKRDAKVQGAAHADIVPQLDGLLDDSVGDPVSEIDRLTQRLI